MNQVYSISYSFIKAQSSIVHGNTLQFLSNSFYDVDLSIGNHFTVAYSFPFLYVNVPLLDIHKMILRKYEGKLPNGKILPVISNQK